MIKCSVCGKPADKPYRRIIDGIIVEGCVDGCHEEHLIPTTSSWNWHMSKKAKKARDNHNKYLKSVGIKRLKGRYI